MSVPFLIPLRESLQCAAVLWLVASFPSVRDNRTLLRSLLAGVFAAGVTGFLLGYVQLLRDIFPSRDAWLFWRHASEAVVFGLGGVLVLAPLRVPSALAPFLLFVLGFETFFFEARAAGFLVEDSGALQGKHLQALVSGAAGLALGFGLLPACLRLFRKVPVERAFTLPSLLMAVGTLQFAFGGAGELEKGNILVQLQQGFMVFLSGAVRSVQTALLIEPHPFFEVPFSGLAEYLSGDRTAMTAGFLLVMTPPLLFLIHLFAKPEPVVSSHAGAQKRATVAFFKKEMVDRSLPVLAVFLALVFLLHAGNLSLNPMYEPAPVTVRADESGQFIRIPLSDKAGDFSDKKLRKFIFYHGEKQIAMIALMKPDSSIGVALDECEICRPADWNVDAKGYSQRGENLVCKYCMTPIASMTLNNPGGCNPIPVPFTTANGQIVIRTGELTALFEKVQKLEKQGTHF
ncbi:MAG: hypothetical protein OHK006_06050 [Thermodesulfovibrionales bacterium]